MRFGACTRIRDSIADSSHGPRFSCMRPEMPKLVKSGKKPSDKIGTSIGRDSAMQRREMPQGDEDAAALVRAARRLVGDDVPVSREEQAIVDEIRAQYRRPSKREIRELAKRLAKFAN
jgi:hypothetical protein